MLELLDLLIDRSFCEIRSPIRQNYSYTVVNSDDGKSAKVYFYATGIRKDDIKISTERENGRDVIIVRGETKREDLNSTFSFQQKLYPRREIDDDISWYLEDGLLVLNVGWKSNKLNHNIKYIGK